MSRPSFVQVLLLGTSIVTLAVVVPLNSLILANPHEPLCISCLTMFYTIPIVLVSLWLYFCRGLLGGKIYAVSLKGLALVSMVFFLHVIEITTIPKGARTIFVVLSILAVIISAVVFFRGRTQVVTLFLTFAFVLSLYEAVNFARIVLRAQGLSSDVVGAVEAPMKLSGQHSNHIFIVVLDEFPLVQVLKDGLLDYERIPFLGKFAEKANWYRQAVASHDETQWAIPAMLLGRQNVGLFRQEFLEQSSATHLFQAAAETHDVYINGYAIEYCKAFHMYSRGCRAYVQGFSDYHLLWQNWWVRAVPGAFRGRYTDRLIRDTISIFFGSLYLKRNVQVSFQDALKLGQDFSRPTFNYIHIALPHHPFVFRANGEIRWDPIESIFVFPNMSLERLQEARDHCREQITFTDHLLGQFLGQLKNLKLYESSLIIITSDHGISFDPAHPGRGNGWINEEIARIPLIIKFPGQQKGLIDDRPVSLIDLYPTLLEWLGQNNDAPDGVSVFSKNWNLRRPLVTDSINSIGCARRACTKGEEQQRFLKTKNGWVKVPIR